MVIQYTQAEAGAPAGSIEVTALSVAQIGGKVRMMFNVKYTNDTAYSLSFVPPSYNVTGYDAQDNVTMSQRSGNTALDGASDITVASLSNYTAMYMVQWTGSTGMSTKYTINVTSGPHSDSYTGDGEDVIE